MTPYKVQYLDADGDILHQIKLTYLQRYDLWANGPDNTRLVHIYSEDTFQGIYFDKLSEEVHTLLPQG